eukprot:11177754-Alexandrium_andersonii.AAC.1
MYNLGVYDVESIALCPPKGPGDLGGPESSDTGPGSGEAEEGRELEVAQDPSAPTDEERQRHERTHVPFRSWCTRCARGGGGCRISARA